jgi:DNA-binding CsgD family transcriptional regulator
MLSAKNSDDQLLDLLYSAPGHPEAWTLFLGEVAHRVDAHWTGLLSFDASANERCINSNFRIPDEAQHLYTQYYAAIDSWYHGFKRKQIPVWAGRGSDLYPQWQLEKNEFRHDFLHRFDLLYQAGIIFEESDGGMTVLTTLRRPSQRDYGREEVAFLRQLTPHLQRALQLHNKMIDLKQASAAAANILDSIDVGLLGLTGEGKVCFTNARADLILRSAEILSLKQERVITRNPRAQAAWQRALSLAHSPKIDARSACKALTLRSAERTLYVTMLPLRHNAHVLPQQLSPRQISVLVVITDPNLQPASRQQLLTDLFGLTPAEARVTMLLVSGMDPNEIAALTATTPNTVRFQLKVIYRKAGVSRQSQLVRLVSMLPGKA